MPRTSAGLIMFRRCRGGVEVLLVHPGGPLWKDRDAGGWSIPKGHVEPGEDILAAARREFTEETGLTAKGPFIPLTAVQERSGKIVHAWAFEGDCDVCALVSNTFTMEWPPRSGRVAEFPEVDRAAFFTPDQAREKLHAGLDGLVDQLEEFMRNPPK
ncbi:MAG: NUDIX domain-containing protein [Planctomycetaceae bacterium]|nr:NUDIX domain-containing protein [Planctomycetaceae bacterium]